MEVTRETIRRVPPAFDRSEWEERAEQLNALFEELDLEPAVRLDYSGRGMFGTRCIGVDLDESAGSREAVIHACGKVGLPVPKTDCMGLGYIIYWERWRVWDEWTDELHEFLEEEWTFLIQ